MEKRIEFQRLYVELMKIRKDKSDNNWIKINDKVEVYCSSELANYYIRTGMYDCRSSYIAVKLDNINTDDEDINFDYILPIMRETLER